MKKALHLYDVKACKKEGRTLEPSIKVSKGKCVCVQKQPCYIFHAHLLYDVFAQYECLSLFAERKRKPTSVHCEAKGRFRGSLQDWQVD